VTHKVPDRARDEVKAAVQAAYYAPNREIAEMIVHRKTDSRGPFGWPVVSTAERTGSVGKRGGEGYEIGKTDTVSCDRLCGCSRGDQEVDPESWREIAPREGKAITWTENFKTDTAYWRLSWSTQRDAEGKKRFRIDVRALDEFRMEEVVSDDDPDQGSVIVELQGTLCLGIDARQPRVIWIEVPE